MQHRGPLGPAATLPRLPGLRLPPQGVASGGPSTSRPTGPGLGHFPGLISPHAAPPGGRADAGLVSAQPTLHRIQLSALPLQHSHLPVSQVTFPVSQAVPSSPVKDQPGRLEAGGEPRPGGQSAAVPPCCPAPACRGSQMSPGSVATWGDW